MSAERWRPVAGFVGAYEVSDLGRVRSLDRVVECCGPLKGRYLSRKPGRLLSPGEMSGGHVSVVLGRKAGSRTVHSLVMEAFVGPPPVGLEIRHKDGNPKNNALSNLEYATRGRNTQDKKWHKGTRTAKLTPATAKEILIRLRDGRFTSQKALAEEYGVSSSTIGAMKAGKFHNDIRSAL